jgi:hypothetical protein
MLLNAGPVPFEANIRHMVSILRDDKRDHRASDVSAYAQRLHEITLHAMKPAKVACAKGCYYCCHTFVTIVPSEVFRVAQALRERSDEMRSRINDTQTKTADIPQTEKWRSLVPCPLLEAEACSVHNIRPLTCRGCVSTSAEVCNRVYMQGKGEVPPTPLEYTSVTTAVAAVLSAALRLVGLQDRTIDWNGALAVAISMPDSEERWLAGEKIFEGVTEGVGTKPGTPFDNMVRGLVENVAPTI